MVFSKTVKWQLVVMCFGAVMSVRTASEAGSGGHAGSPFSLGNGVTGHGHQGLVSRRATAWQAMVARFSVLDSGFWVLGSGFWVLGPGFWILGSGF